MRITLPQAIFDLLSLYQYTSSKDKRRVYIAFALMLASAISEILLLGSISDIIRRLGDYQRLYKDSTLTISEHFGTDFVFGGLGTLAATLLAATALRLKSLNYSLNLVGKLGTTLSSKYYKNFLGKPYINIKASNTNTELATMTTLINTTVTSISSFAQLALSCIILSAAIGWLLISNGVVTLATITFVGGTYLAIYYHSKRTLLNNSLLIARLTKDQFRALKEGMGNIREVKLRYSYETYVKEYRKIDSYLRTAISESLYVSSYPRYILEAFVIIFFIGVFLLGICLDLLDSRQIDGFLLILFATQRLLPVAQSAFSSYTLIISYSSSVSSVLQGLASIYVEPVQIHKSNKSKSKDALEKHYVLKVSGITLAIEKDNNKCEEILSDVTFSINKGDRVALIGPSGSGKSTLIDVIMGLIRPTFGQVLLNGNIINSTSFTDVSWMDSIACMSQQTFLFDDTIEKNISLCFGQTNPNYSKLELACRLANVKEFVDQLPGRMSCIVGENGSRLSGGQRQRLGLARALYKSQSILVMDEPTSSLDLDSERRIVNNLSKLPASVTLIIATHRPEILKICNKIVEMDKGTARLIDSGRLFTSQTDGEEL